MPFLSRGATIAHARTCFSVRLSECYVLLADVESAYDHAIRVRTSWRKVGVHDRVILLEKSGRFLAVVWR